MRKARWTENKLKAKVVELGRSLHPTWVWLPMQERTKSGIPDLLVTGNNVTSFWEFKYANPTFDSQGLQELTMARLAAQSHRAYYIIFDNRNPEKLMGIHIVHPSVLKLWSTHSLWRSGGFKDVIEIIELTHHIEVFRP